MIPMFSNPENNQRWRTAWTFQRERCLLQITMNRVQLIAELYENDGERIFNIHPKLGKI